MFRLVTNHLLFVTLCLGATSCKREQPTQAPEPTPAPAPRPEQASKPEPKPEPPKVPKDATAIGSFNLDWAFDNLDDRRPKRARTQAAQTDDQWEWKRNAIADVLVKEKLHIVGVQEIGGERELSDIVLAIRDRGGPDYNYAFVPSDDKHTGKHVGILSVYPISNARRLDANMRKQMAADIELPTGDAMTMVVVHARTGQYPAYRSSRRKQAKSVKRRLIRTQKKQPVVVAGTFNSRGLPHDDDYGQTSAGIFAGKNTRTEADDCFDSAEHGLAQSSTVAGEPYDRIFVCGLEMRGAEASSHDAIVREQTDPPDAPWRDVPVDKEPHRDVSKHLVVWAEVVLPKPPEEPKKTQDPFADGEQ